MPDGENVDFSLRLIRQAYSSRVHHLVGHNQSRTLCPLFDLMNWATYGYIFLIISMSFFDSFEFEFVGPSPSEKSRPSNE